MALFMMEELAPSLAEQDFSRVSASKMLEETLEECFAICLASGEIWGLSEDLSLMESADPDKKEEKGFLSKIADAVKRAWKALVDMARRAWAYVRQKFTVIRNWILAKMSGQPSQQGAASKSDQPSQPTAKSADAPPANSVRLEGTTGIEIRNNLDVIRKEIDALDSLNQEYTRANGSNEINALTDRLQAVKPAKPIRTGNSALAHTYTSKDDFLELLTLTGELNEIINTRITETSEEALFYDGFEEDENSNETVKTMVAKQKFLSSLCGRYSAVLSVFGQLAAVLQKSTPT